MKIRILLAALLCCTLSLSYGQLETFGIIGSATPMGWDADTDMTPNADSTIWTIQLQLNDGEVKWRPNDRWDDPLTDWGGKSFPYGDLLNKAEDGDAPNVAVYPGLYDITVDLVNKTYSFQAISDVGIIGEATPLGWDLDTDMIQDSANTARFFTTIDLTAGPFKFRAFDDWAVNWGGTWPGGDLVLGAPDNIECPKAGSYDIEIDTAAMTWSATENVLFQSIGLIGGDVVGSWDEDVDMSANPFDPNLYEDTLTVGTGEGKFRANDDWAISWAQEGPEGFPMGIGTSGPQNISIEGGSYYITLNVESGAYNFRSYEDFTGVSILGVNGDFDPANAVAMESANGYDWQVRVEIGDDQLLFIGDQNSDFTYGAADFPAGTADLAGSPIPTAAGEYFVYFSSITGRYSFDEIIEYDAVSLVGKSGPFLAWPAEDDMGAVDFFLTQSPDNGDVWTGEGIELVDYDPAADGGVKFRADTAWTVNWGAVDFPAGVGTQNGANIEPVGGTYEVVFNSASGEYTFAEGSSVQDDYSLEDIAVYPNPASDQLSIDLSALDYNGDVQLTVYDLSGKVASERTVAFKKLMTLDVSQMRTGSYFMQLKSDAFVIGKRFMVQH